MIAAQLASASQRLAATTPTPKLDAELLLAHVLGVDRAWLHAHDTAPVAGEAAAAVAALIERRAAGEPVAYLLGRREFWTLTLAVDRRVLVPRPETELLVELGLERLKGHAGPRVLDLGTGSGAIGLAIAAERRDALVDLVDASADALAVAEHNRLRHGLANARTRLGDWYAAVAGARYSLIVANPPYLRDDDPQLATPALRHEPRAALLAGPSGLEAITTVASGAFDVLEPGATLIVEHGAEQGGASRALLAAAGLARVETRRDLAGLERATLGTRPG
jgi:release factor glutamine methyltransferase